MYRYLVGGSLIALLESGCAGAKSPAETMVDGQAIAREDQRGNWLSVGPTYAEQHYSPLTAIDVENVTEVAAVVRLMEGLGISYVLQTDATGERVASLIVPGVTGGSSRVATNAAPACPRCPD